MKAINYACGLLQFERTSKIKAYSSISRSRSMSQATKKLRFDGQTAIITGAGRGLGREYALLLASRGCNVVVNDVGGDRAGVMSDESDSGAKVAEQMVKEIAQRSPEAKAIANFESISNEDGARRLVESTIEKFGRVDILINNAGILRDRSMAKANIDEWDLVHSVHLKGSFLMSRACWPYMRKQDYGKIIMTSSTSGLYGNFGQSNYSAAKMGLIGLSNTLAIEGRKYNISCNTIVPLAASRLTMDILPEDLAAKLKSCHVAPLVAWLCHKDCSDSGSIFEAAGGWFGRYKLHRSYGKYIEGAGEKEDTLEKIAENWSEINTFDDRAQHINSFHDHLTELIMSFKRDK